MTNRRNFIAGLALAGLSGSAVPGSSSKSGVGSTSRLSFNGFYFGWNREIPTLKTEIFTSIFSEANPLPMSVDLRSSMPPVYDQGEIGSCTSNAVAACVQFARRKSGQSPDFVPSRLFIYYNGRVTENTVASDSGLSIRDGIGVVENVGVCPEAVWPYDALKADEKGSFPKPNNRAVVRPPRKIYKDDAWPHRAITASSIPQRKDELKACLAAGFPFAFGFTIYPSFFDANGRPRINIPTPTPQEIPKSGHAVVAVGYDDDTQMFVCRNSWNTKDAKGEVQEKGHFYMPYAYVLDPDLAADFWTIRAVFAVM